MDWIPNGDTIIVERYQAPSNIVMPDDIGVHEGDVFIVKKVGCGYVTDHGVIVEPEVEVGDMVVLKGKMLNVNVLGDKFIMARAQDVLCYKRAVKMEQVNGLG